MKSFFKLIISLTILLGFFWTTINFIIWQQCPNGKSGKFSFDLSDAIENHSIIAIYITDSSTDQNRIRLERIEEREPWKYIFYTPRNFSNGFYVSWGNELQDIKFIIADHDTVMKNGIRPMTKLPEKLTVHFNHDTVSAIYHLETKYQENIDNIATIPFYKKWDSGPFLNNN